MGKETKIGLAVIAVLLIIFCVVLVRRLTRPSERTEVAIAADNDKDKEREREREREKEKDLFKNKSGWAESESKPLTKIHELSKPTVLSPAELPSKMASHAPDDVSGQWSTASDMDTKRHHSDAKLASDLSPAYIPPPPAPIADDRYGVSMDSRRAASAPSAMLVGDSGGAALAPARNASDPFKDRADHNSPAFAEHNRREYNSMRVPEPSPPAPPYQEPTRYPYSAASSDAGRGYSTPGATERSASRDFYPGSRNDATMPNASGMGGNSLRADRVASHHYDNGDSWRSDGVESTKQYSAEHFGHAGGTYEIQPNDNYWVISEKVYGTGAYFKALAEHNRGKVAQPNKLRVGDTISTPTIVQLEKDHPDLCPKPSRRETVRNRASLASTHGSYAGGRTYEVQEGDTLFDIARNELGKASRWAEIYDINREALGKDFDYLTPGMVLSLPAKDASVPTDKTTQRTGALFDR
jgi:nucleoid-associated protein YgaU